MKKKLYGGMDRKLQEVKPIRELPPELNNDKKNKIHISHKRNINGNGR